MFTLERNGQLIASSQVDAAFSCDIRGKTALVTGASSGIGAHVAGTLARAGARVVAAARHENRLAETVRQIREAGGTALAIPMDVTDLASIQRGFEHAKSEFGLIDVLVNDAGITLTKAALDIELSEWDQVFATNLRGVFFVAQAFARRLVEAKKPGSIVNVASIMGERVAGAVAPYAVSKAGVLHLTRVLALEWARYQIRVNAIAPGYVRTALTESFFATPGGEAMIKRIPQRRLGTFEDLDAPILLLASDASSYMTGSIITVDGGHVVSSL
jgi:NAD(P)-dependent dehydrogenase (short-subunit alcohol dehydrogenase family)